MTPQDVVWRILERLNESKEMVTTSVQELHPVRHHHLISTLQEVEQLIQTQINLMNRARRRYLKE